MLKSARHKTAVMLTSLLMLYNTTCISNSAFQKRDIVENAYSAQLMKNDPSSQGKKTLQIKSDTVKIVGEKQFDVRLDPKTMVLTLKFSAKDSSEFDATKEISCATSKKIREIRYFKSPDGNGAHIIFDNAILMVMPNGLDDAAIAGLCPQDSSKIIKLFLAEDGALFAITPTTCLMNSPTSAFTFLFTEKVFGKGPYKVDVAQADATHVLITCVNSVNKTVKILIEPKTHIMKRLL